MTAAALPQGRRGGRTERRQVRTTSLAHDKDIVRAGMTGGVYRPLTTPDIERINETALRILETYGMRDAAPNAQDTLLKGGGRMTEDGRILISRKMVERALNVACREFEVVGIDGVRKIVLGGARVNFGGNSYTPNVRDLETREFREPTVTDLYDLTRLEDKLDNLHYVRIPVIARDVAPDEFDINSAYAVASGTGKPFCLTVSFVQYVDPVFDMFDMIAGGTGQYAKRPFCLPICVHVVPPLKFATENCFVIQRMVERGAPVIMYSAGMSGATSPAALAGMLAQSLAETYAGLVWINLLKPGHPMLFGLSPLAADLRFGSCNMGMAEEALMQAASAQICQYLGIPGAQLAGSTDAKEIDIQAGWERSYGAMAQVLAGSNHIGINAGGYASNMGMIAESLVIDNDQIGCVLRILKGIEVSDESLSFETIGDVIRGEGHFLGHPETMKLMHSEYYYPEFADRTAIGDWEMAGKPKIEDRARKRVIEILDSNYPRYVDAAVDADIRKRFTIRLPVEAMSPGSRRPLVASSMSIA
ncbi:MAG: trimethylamine methyltransferase family protein [Hyphomicrobiaceae bacterium]